MDVDPVSSKRARPRARIRKILQLLGVSLALIVGWFTWQVVALMKAEPNIAVDYTAEIHARAAKALGRPVMTDPLAWDAFVAGLREASDIVAEHERALLEFDDPSPRWNDGQTALLDLEYLTRSPSLPSDAEPELACIEALHMEGIFDKMSQLLSGPIALRPAPSDGALLNRLMPALGDAREYASACVASMRVASAAGDFSETCRALEDVLSLAQHIAVQGVVLDHLVGMSINYMALTEITYQLNEIEMDEETARSILASIDERRLPPVSVAVEGERSQFLDFLQRSYSDDGAGDGFLLAHAAASMERSNTNEDVEVSTRKELSAAINGRFSRPTRSHETRLFDQYTEAALGEAEGRPVDHNPGFADPLFGADSASTLAAVLAGPAGETIARDGTIRTVHEGVRIAVAIEVFYAMRHRYPTHLDELVPGTLPQSPVDPLHGGPFGYRLLDEPDEHGRHYLLYSTGMDLTDNGGTLVDPNQVAGGVAAPLIDHDLAGVDFVINQYRGWLDEDASDE